MVEGLELEVEVFWVVGECQSFLLSAESLTLSETCQNHSESVTHRRLIPSISLPGSGSRSRSEEEQQS